MLIFRRMCALVLVGLCGVMPLQGQACGTFFDKETKTAVGQPMPQFSVKRTDGTTFSLASERGKVVLVNFWATWCGPCKVEMPRLEKEIWQRHKDDPHFAMIAIAREQDTATIQEFVTHQPYTFPFAEDPKRSTYALFAGAGIPRSYVVGKDGKILMQTVGSCPADLDKLGKVIEEALAAK